MADTLATVCAKVRALLLDPDAQEYLDSVLLPYVGMAQSQLDAFLTSKSIPRYRDEALLTVPAGTKVISATTTPALPADCLQPISLHERLSGSTNVRDWIAMTQVRGDLPNSDQSSTLSIWAWQTGEIHLVGATTDRQVQLDYLNVPAEVALPADVLPVPDSAEAVSLLTAALVCEAHGASQQADRFQARYLAERNVIYDIAQRRKPVLRRKFYYPSPTRSRLPYIT